MQTATPLTRRITTALPLLAAVLAAMPAQTRAASGTWSGDAGADPFAPDSAWSNAGNWTGGVPGTGDTATFGPTVNPVAVNTGGATINTLSFLSGAPTYAFTGALTLNAGGSLSMAAGAGAQTLPTLNATAGGTAQLTNDSANLLSVGLSAPAPATGTTTVTFSGSGNITTTAALVAAANTATSLSSFVKNGTGTLTLGNFSNTNIWGGFTLNGGTVIALNNNSLSNRGLTLNGATLNHRVNNGQSFNSGSALINVTADSKLVYGLDGTTTGNWTIGGNSGGQLTSANNPTLTFETSAPNINGIRLSIQTQNFAGTWKLGQNGALSLNQNYAPGSAGVHLNMGDAGTGSHYFATGAQFTNTGTGGQNIIPVKFGALSGADTGSIFTGRQNVGTGTTGARFEVGQLNTNTTYAGSIRDGHTSNGNITLNGNADGTNQTAPFTSNYARTNGAAGSQGTVEFVKVGSGTLTLTGTNTHTGGTVIAGGRIAVSSDAALGATYDGSLRPFQLAAGTGVYTNTDLPTATISGGGAPTVAASVGVFSATLGNNVNNNLFLSFSAQNNDAETGAITNIATGSGYTSIPTVTLSDVPLATAGSAPVVQVRVKGLLTLDGGTLQTDAGITSNRAVVVTSAGGTIDTNGFDSTFSGVINGSGDLTKTGNGILTLTGDNTLTGLTTVAGGVLNLEGTLAGSVAVNAGGSLTGDGTAGSATILGTIAPGNSIGELNFGGPTTLSGTAMIELDAAGAPNADLINVAGAVTLGGDLTVSWLSAPAPGTYNIIAATSFSGSFANVNLPALTGSLTWDTSQLNTAGILTVVPEPGSALLALLSSGLLLRRRRR